jgi:hypothetical protein
MADTPNSASSIVALLNAQDAGTSLAEQHFDQRLADVRAEFQRQLAAADRRTARAAGHGDQANEFARMSDALRLIDQHGCTHLTTGRCWEAGYTRGAPYSADAWCDACVAADALQEVAR